MSIPVIIFMNLVPLLGIIFLGWSGGMIASLYALETIFIGFLTVIKMAITQNIHTQGHQLVASKTSSGELFLAKLFMIPFFMFHYGVFVLAQGAIIIAFSVVYDKNSFSKTQFWVIFSLSLVSVLVGQCISFWRDFLKPKLYKTKAIIELMAEPYARVFIQQFVAVGGIVLSNVFKWELVFGILLILFKTIYEVCLHYIKEAKKKQTI